MSFEEEYLIFRHIVSRKKWSSKIDFSKKQELIVSASDIELMLKNNLKKHAGSASFVSGGLDSSLLASILQVKDIYASYFGDKSYDEIEWAEKVAKHVGARIHPVLITKDRYISAMEYLIRNKKCGLHPNEVCLYLTAIQAKSDGYSNIISGEGADDIFGGYSDLLKNEKLYLKDKETFLNRYAYFRPSKIGMKEPFAFSLYKKWGMERFILEVHTPGLIERAINACKSADIEVAFPYLEGELPQSMWEVKSSLKKEKNLLKKVATKYLPKNIVFREKVGFPIPIEKWFGGIDRFLLFNLEIWQNK